MKKLTRLATTIVVYVLLSALLVTSVSAFAGLSGYELVVEESSNFFPIAMTGYKDIASLYGDEEEHIIWAEYRICAPGFRIAEFDFELTYDEESLEFVDEQEIGSSPVGTSWEETDIIPEISEYGEYSFEPWADSETEGRGRMTLHYIGSAVATNELGGDIALVKVPFQVYSTDLDIVNIDLQVMTLTLVSDNDVPGSDFVENAITDNVLFVVENGIVNESYNDVYSLLTILSPTGEDLTEPVEEYLTIHFDNEFAQGLPDRVVKVSEGKAFITFYAATDLDFEYLTWTVKVDPSKLVVKGASSLGIEKGHYFIDEENNFGYYYLSPGEPMHINKGEPIAAINVSILDGGETTLHFSGSTEEGGHKVTIDMGGHGNNISFDVDDGENLYEALKKQNLNPYKDDGYLLACLHTKPLSKMESAEEYQSLYFIDKDIFDKPVTSDVTVYAIWLKVIQFEFPDITCYYEKDSAAGLKPEVTLSSNAHYTFECPPLSDKYPLDGFSSSIDGTIEVLGSLCFGSFSANADLGYIFDFSLDYSQIPTIPFRHILTIYSYDDNYCMLEYYRTILVADSGKYMDDYGYEWDFTYIIKLSFKDSKVDEKIKDINKTISDEDLSLDNSEAIKKAKEEYDSLTDEQKKLIPPEIADKLFAYDVAVDIDALPPIDKITPDDKESIEKAKKAYEELTEEQKKLVPPEIVDKLLVSELTLDVITLPDTDKLTPDDKDAVKAAKETFDKLTDEQKLLVPQEIVDKLMAENVIVDIISLPDADKITANDKEAIEAARKAYEALTDEQKKLVPKEVLDKLAAAEEAIKKSSIEMPSVFVIIIIVVAVAAVLFLIVFLVSKKKKKQ